MNAIKDKQAEYALIERLAEANPRFCDKACNQALSRCIQWVNEDCRDNAEFYNQHMSVYLADDPEALAIWQAIGTPEVAKLSRSNPRANRAMLDGLLVTLQTTQPALYAHLRNLDRIMVQHQKEGKTS